MRSPYYESEDSPQTHEDIVTLRFGNYYPTMMNFVTVTRRVTKEGPNSMRNTQNWCNHLWESHTCKWSPIRAAVWLTPEIRESSRPKLMNNISSPFSNCRQNSKLFKGRSKDFFPIVQVSYNALPTWQDRWRTAFIEDQILAQRSDILSMET